jgi:bacterioferritin-associated ferredoxin
MMLYVQEYLLENPTVSLLRIIHTNEVYYIVPCSEFASTTTITTQSCVDGTVPLSIPLPAKAKCNVVKNQQARDAVAAKTATVEKPASKDGVGSTEDCVSQYSADSQQTQEKRTIANPFIPDAHG